MANDATTKESFSILKKRAILTLQRIRGESVGDQIQKLEEELFMMFEPGVYHGSSGIEVRHIKGFNGTCVVLHQMQPKDPKTMTVVEYLQTLQIVKDQIKKNK